ncbi:hypothetical protein [Salinisphaera sp. T31B1]|uniref:DUF6918 family protein n=1 Tax=Salinisphaera sp. T31B1 TaxID=727963 RepID=UPI003342C263
MAQTQTQTRAADMPVGAQGPLGAQLLAPDTFPRLVSDACALVEREIGKRGMTMRTAYSVALRLKPDLVTRTVRELMPGFVAELEPLYADCQTRDENFHDYLIAHGHTVADAMLNMADERAERIHSRAISSGYKRVRGRARREIVDAMPQIATVISSHCR